MKRNMTSEDLCHIFFNLEKKYDLLDYKFSDIKIWQAIRMKLYYEIAVKANIEEQSHSVLRSKEKLYKLKSYIYNSFKYNPFFHQNSDIVVFSHPRTKLVNDENIDIYTKYFLDQLKDEDVNYLELESAYLGVHTKMLTNNTSYTDFIILTANILKKFVKISFSNKEKNLIQNINYFLTESLGIKIDITNIIIESIQSYKIKYFLYKRLLKKLNTKQLYIVVSYGSPEIIKAAKDLKIKVSEFQHGIFSEFHLGYSYPNREKKLDHFPDEFLVWNQYWKDLIKLPISYDHIKIKPFEYLEINKQKYKNIKKLNQIVVLSQGNVGNHLARLILNKMAIFKDIKIIYKLHPGEYDRYKNYEALDKLLKKDTNIEIVEDTDLHMLLASSKYQLGINSTALLEGVEFNCETILFDTSGIEYMTKFIEFYGLLKSDNMFISNNIRKDFNL